MSRIKPCTVSLQALRGLLAYNPDSGKFWWHKSGLLAGYLGSDGYWKIKISGRMYMAHRLAWFYVNGVYPDLQIDHKNLDRDDNKLSNLRLAEPWQNIVNTRVKCHSKSGIKGVRFDERVGRYRVEIRRNKARVFNGWFDDATEASLAYQRESKKIFGEFSRSTPVAPTELQAEQASQ